MAIGKVVEKRIYIDEEEIPPVMERPVNSLGRWYKRMLDDTEQVQKLRKYVIDGIERIE